MNRLRHLLSMAVAWLALAACQPGTGPLDACYTEIDQLGEELYVLTCVQNSCSNQTGTPSAEMMATYTEDCQWLYAQHDNYWGEQQGRCIDGCAAKDCLRVLRDDPCRERMPPECTTTTFGEIIDGEPTCDSLVEGSYIPREE